MPLEHGSLQQILTSSSPLLHRGIKILPHVEGRRFLSSADKRLDQFLQGGLAFGTVTEWGMPWGLGGRELIIQFLASATQGLCQSNPINPLISPVSPLWCLWVQATGSELSIYPPSWWARGVNLNYMRFACSKQLLTELKSIFIDPFFKVIIIDRPLSFKSADWLFMAKMARQQKQLILILQDYFLTPRLGNIWVRQRFNCHIDAMSEHFQLSKIKGGGTEGATFRGTLKT